MDKISIKQRSQIMASIKSKNSTPEITVRKAVFKLGYRFRLHRSDLPGTPDLAFIGKQKVIFVHGCFWHCHPGCKRASTPKSNVEFWKNKLDRNVQRDLQAQKSLVAMGWSFLIVWECEIRDLKKLSKKITDFLSQDHVSP